jgi:hypothetical protein
VSGWLYWLLFVLACLVALFAGPWFIDLLERRADEADRRTWREMGGGRW